MASDRKIPYVDLGAQYTKEREEMLAIIDRVMTDGQMVGGKAVADFEEQTASFHGTRHAVALNSGTDALYFALKAMGIGPGDEVITPPNSFVASTAVVVQAGATPVFVDVLDDQNIDPAKIEAAVTPRTKAIMPVHLTGRVAAMDAVAAIAGRHKLMVIEDSAQAIGSRYQDRLSGTFGEIGCFSAHPLKNLNAAGDAGFLVTDNDEYADTIRLLRNHGLADRNTVTRFGQVSRMDTLQAAILCHRLKQLDDVIERRRANAELYQKHLDPEFVFAPAERQHEFNTYHTYVIQVDHRDALQRHLHERGIGTAIHYPIPIHLQPAAAYLGHKPGDFPVCERQAQRILTLPVHPGLAPDDVLHVATEVNTFLRSQRNSAA